MVCMCICMYIYILQVHISQQPPLPMIFNFGPTEQSKGIVSRLLGRQLGFTLVWNHWRHCFFLRYYHYPPKQDGRCHDSTCQSVLPQFLYIEPFPNPSVSRPPQCPNFEVSQVQKHWRGDSIWNPLWPEPSVFPPPVCISFSQTCTKHHWSEVMAHACPNLLQVLAGVRHALLYYIYTYIS